MSVNYEFFMRNVLVYKNVWELLENSFVRFVSEDITRIRLIVKYYIIISSRFTVIYLEVNMKRGRPCEPSFRDLFAESNIYLYLLF